MFHLLLSQCSGGTKVGRAKNRRWIDSLSAVENLTLLKWSIPF